MSPALAAALLDELFGTPTPEWHPGITDTLAALARLDLDHDREATP